MVLKIIGSSSAGNAYALISEEETLLIECGVRFQLVKQALGFKISNVVGQLITHSHLDHCRATQAVVNAGIDVYASFGTIREIGIRSHRMKAIMAGTMIKMGAFKVKAFDVEHDTAEPFGFLIHHKECGSTLFMTDSYFSAYNFRGLSNIIVEANFDETVLDGRTFSGDNPRFLRDRIKESHMSIQTCKKFLIASDLSQVQKIILIHLSNSNSDEANFKSEIEKATGKRVYVADAGMDIELNKSPF